MKTPFFFGEANPFGNLILGSVFILKTNCSFWVLRLMQEKSQRTTWDFVPTRRKSWDEPTDATSTGEFTAGFLVANNSITQEFQVPLNWRNPRNTYVYIAGPRMRTRNHSKNSRLNAIRVRKANLKAMPLKFEAYRTALRLWRLGTSTKSGWLVGDGLECCGLLLVRLQCQRPGIWAILTPNKTPNMKHRDPRRSDASSEGFTFGFRFQFPRSVVWRFFTNPGRFSRHRWSTTQRGWKDTLPRW